MGIHCHRHWFYNHFHFQKEITGVDANTIYGDSYIFTLPGNNMGFAVNSGRMAGENAAEYVKLR